MYRKWLIVLILIFNVSVQAKSLKEFTLPVYNEEGNYTFAKGKKTLVNFWASWCTSCIQEIPILEELKRKNPKVSFIAINAGDSKKKIKKFLKKTGFSYKVLMDRTKKTSKDMGILSLPQTIVVNEKGDIVFHKNVPPKSL